MQPNQGDSPQGTAQKRKDGQTPNTQQQSSTIHLMMAYRNRKSQVLRRPMQGSSKALGIVQHVVIGRRNLLAPFLGGIVRLRCYYGHVIHVCLLVVVAFRWDWLILGIAFLPIAQVCGSSSSPNLLLCMSFAGNGGYCWPLFLLFLETSNPKECIMTANRSTQASIDN